MRKILFLSLILGAFITSAAAQPGAADILLSVPDINGMAVTLVKPAFPETAVAANADGSAVSLRVVVDENGNVISAMCSLTCHAMLKGAAELAALQSKFKPLIKDGLAIKYQGTLLYTFVVSRVDWFRFGTALESTRQFDNLSLGPVAQILSTEFLKEKASLSGLDANGGADYDRRQNVIREVTASVKARLKGIDLWRFELGMALRRITFWPQARETVNRAELQNAINDLSTYIASAPQGVSEGLIKELTAISRYRVPTDMSERDLRRAIVNLTRNLGPHLK